MNKGMISAEERILDAGFKDVIILQNHSYDSALIGVTHDNRAVYDYDLMVEYLMDVEGLTDEESIDWLEYNTIRALPYMGSKSPIVATEDDYPTLMYTVV